MQPGRDLPPEEQDWHRFRQLHQLHNHWQRPGWSDGRRSYHWFLTFEHASGLHALASQCQEPFHHLPQFDLVPLGSLHLTIERLAFTDEFSSSGLPAVVDTVRRRCRNVRPVQLRIGWLAASPGAIRLTALPVTAVEEMRRAVTTQEDHADTQTKAPKCNAHDGFWPHVSVAYSNTVQPTTTVTAKIEALRSLPPAEVPVMHMTLVELTRDGSAYRWEEVDRVALGG